MTKHTIQQLNALNNTFYQKVESSFDESRSTAWTGWLRLVPSLVQLVSKLDQPIRVLDLGCGNGRFLTFLDQHIGSSKFEYTGCDSAEGLLARAQARANLHQGGAEFIQLDIVEALLENQLASRFSQSFHWIVAFGVLHHVPGASMRRQFFGALHQLLHPSGTAAVAAWQFQHSPRLLQRALKPELLGIDTQDLEPNDYLLDWHRGANAARYCHLTTQSELYDLAAGAGFTVADEFDADGHEGILNKYMLLKP